MRKNGFNVRLKGLISYIGKMFRVDRYLEMYSIETVQNHSKRTLTSAVNWSKTTHLFLKACVSDQFVNDLLNVKKGMLVLA